MMILWRIVFLNFRASLRVWHMYIPQVSLPMDPLLLCQWLTSWHSVEVCWHRIVPVSPPHFIPRPPTIHVTCFRLKWQKRTRTGNVCPRHRLPYLGPSYPIDHPKTLSGPFCGENVCGWKLPSAYHFSNLGRRFSCVSIVLILNTQFNVPNLTSEHHVSHVDTRAHWVIQIRTPTSRHPP